LSVPKFFIGLLAICGLQVSASAQHATIDRPKVIAQAAALLEQRYVDPAGGRRLAAKLRGTARQWRGFKTETEFAQAVTKWLRDQSGDGHLGLDYSEQPITENAAGSTFADAEIERYYGRAVNHGVRRFEWLDGRIAYLELTVFPPREMAGDVIAAAMTLAAQGDALILDLRRNGGGMGTASMVAGYLLRPGSPMSGTYDRPTDRLTEQRSPGNLPGRRFGEAKPVYILTSKRTFSAAEAVAYDLQALGRATIVGEVTGGGANPFEYRVIHPHFALSLPEQRSVNPITGRNWQSVGVKPDVAVHAHQALDTAVALAKKAIESRGASSMNLKAAAKDAMHTTGARGLALALIENGQVSSIGAFGDRNAAGDPLDAATVMYGASLTKAVFAYTVMQLVDEGRIGLDQPIASMLSKPLPDHDDAANLYADYRSLKNDGRWRKLTPRMLLSHSSGFANFGFLEPDGKLKFHFEPGRRYAYSGDGIILLQFALERGLGLDLGAEMQRRVFDRFGMTRTSMKWRDDFRPNLADGWKQDGSVEPHDERSSVRAAGSMDTTIADFAKFAAAFVRGDGLTPDSARAMRTAQLPITTRSQFPTLQPEAPPGARVPGLGAGLGVVVFQGPQGRGFFKGGHNDSTGNMWVCIERGQRCAVILSNDVRAEAAFPAIVRALLGETGMPWRWEYGDQPWTR
jgi:CubicO group peptidase (beta-lactamase class C family)